jgi:hypothetical protein
VSPGAIVFAFTSSSYILGHWSWHFEHCTPIALH